MCGVTFHFLIVYFALKVVRCRFGDKKEILACEIFYRQVYRNYFETITETG